MSDVQEASVAVSTTNVTLVTTAETVILSAPRIAVPRQSVFALVLAYAQLTTGAAATTVTKRIRRGTTTAAALVGEANAEEVTVAAGGTQQLLAIAGEELAILADVEYSLTLEQAAATGNGTALQAAILVLLL